MPDFLSGSEGPTLVVSIDRHRRLYITHRYLSLLSLPIRRGLQAT